MSIGSVNSNVVTKTNINTGISEGYRTEGMKGIAEKRNRNEGKLDIKYPEERKMSQEDAIEVIEKANKEFIAYDRRFEFSIHEKTNQIMVKVIDVKNDEVIRELPPEKVLDMVAAMWEIAGIIVDKKI